MGAGVDVGEVGLADQQAVGHGGLLHRLLMLVELARAVQRVDRRHDAVQAIVVADHGMC